MYTATDSLHQSVPATGHATRKRIGGVRLGRPPLLLGGQLETAGAVRLRRPQRIAERGADADRRAEDESDREAAAKASHGHGGADAEARAHAGADAEPARRVEADAAACTARQSSCPKEHTMADMA
jgi:hypothetical protein